ncbi:RNA-binding protein 1-like isoform X1 [Phoenix dactylifera]|uniref:RNA-binding protein 1-like isoform X1 n=1 Tax=Phoenix dactylifera TaxID=42345 RepID=A0A8B7CNS7_PHODC|nr:RNA-binding protein 1-like isoform X1 [Phoenix dactylifera]
MADGYWRYSDPRHQAAAMAAPAAPLKRARPDYADIPGGPEMLGYYSRDEERTGHRAIRDTESIAASYDRYLRNGVSSFGAGESVRTVAGGMTSHPVDDRRMMGVGGMDGRSVGYGGGRPEPPLGGMDGRSVGYGGGRPEPPLPQDASNTLFVEGLPANCTRREVSHIFRPFVGFREVRLVNKESRHPGGDPLVLCFVDFSTPAQAAVALDALQGNLIYLAWRMGLLIGSVSTNHDLLLLDIGLIN